MQKWISCSAEGLPCLLFSSFTTKYILVCFVKSCQRPFSIIICFISIARALLYYLLFIVWIQTIFQRYRVPTLARYILWLSHAFTEDFTFAIWSSREVSARINAAEQRGHLQQNSCCPAACNCKGINSMSPVSPCSCLFLRHSLWLDRLIYCMFKGWTKSK